jgi:hypothetical protein
MDGIYIMDGITNLIEKGCGEKTWGKIKMRVLGGDSSGTSLLLLLTDGGRQAQLE